MGEPRVPVVTLVQRTMRLVTEAMYGKGDSWLPWSDLDKKRRAHLR